MRTDREITQKMELMDSENWLEGIASRSVLNYYLPGKLSNAPSALEKQLAKEVALTWVFAIGGEYGDKQRARLSQARVETVIWVMGNTQLIKELEEMSVRGPYIQNRLMLICRHYGLEIPVGKSEEE